MYTNTKFKEVQQEVMGLILCNCTLIKCISIFDVLVDISTDIFVKRVHYYAYFNQNECELKCTYVCIIWYEGDSVQAYV